MVKRIIILALFSTLSCLGQNKVELTTKLSSTTFFVGEQTMIYYSFVMNLSNSARSDAQIKVGQLEGDGFKHNGDRMVENMTSFQSVNGRSSLSVKKTIGSIITFTEIGAFTIPARNFEVAGKIYSGDSLHVIVKKAPPAGKVSKDVELLVETEKKEVYEGEVFKADLSFYSTYDHRISQDNYKFVQENWLVNPLEIKPLKTQLTIGQKKYNKSVIESFALTALDTGNIQIDSAFAAAIITNGYQSLQDVFGSATFQIKVLPLPKKKPSNWLGLVGKILGQAKTDKDTVALNDAITLQIDLSGYVNFNRLKTLNIQFPDQLDVLENPSKTLTPFKNGKKGFKRFEYVLIPRSGGSFLIPNIEISYFNPESKSYETLTIEGKKITVIGNNGIELPQESVPPKNELQKIENDEKSLAWLYILGVFALASIGFFIFLTRKKQPKNELNKAQQKELKKSKAYKLACKEILKTPSLPKEEQIDHLDHHYSAYFIDKLKMDGSDFSSEYLKSSLGKKGIEEALQKAVLSILDQTKMARFAQQSLDIDFLVKQIIEVLEKVDKKL